MFNSKKLAGLAIAFSLFAGAGMAQAASLNSTQISAILSLLSSFGADQGTINSVSTALDGTPASSSLTCSSFSDVSYGQFDNNPGGRVSQLQTWLGIPSNTFGFGTYGNKTQAAWNSRCGSIDRTQQTQQGYSTSVDLSATPASGAAPLRVEFLMNSGVVANPIFDFGDGTSGQLLSFENEGTSKYQVFFNHTYASAGTYTTKYEDSSGNVLATQIITVTGGTVSVTCGTSAGCVVNQPSATIDQSSLMLSSPHVVITGTANDLSQVDVEIFQSTPAAMTAWTSLHAGVTVPVINGRWSYDAGQGDTGINAGMEVEVFTTGNNTGALATGTFVSGGSTSGTPSTTLTATPMSGNTPLAVDFSFWTGGTLNFNKIDFGDGSTLTILGGGYCTQNSCGDIMHTYTIRGTYAAKLEDPSGNVLATQTVSAY